MQPRGTSFRRLDVDGQSTGVHWATLVKYAFILDPAEFGELHRVTVRDPGLRFADERFVIVMGLLADGIHLQWMKVSSLPFVGGRHESRCCGSKSECARYIMWPSQVGRGGRREA